MALTFPSLFIWIPIEPTSQVGTLGGCSRPGHKKIFTADRSVPEHGKRFLGPFESARAEYAFFFILFTQDFLCEKFGRHHRMGHPPFIETCRHIPVRRTPGKASNVGDLVSGHAVLS